MFIVVLGFSIMACCWARVLLFWRAVIGLVGVHAEAIFFVPFMMRSKSWRVRVTSVRPVCMYELLYIIINSFIGFMVWLHAYPTD